MPEFKYRLIREYSKTVEVSVEADNEEDAFAQLDDAAHDEGLHEVRRRIERAFANAPPEGEDTVIDRLLG